MGTVWFTKSAIDPASVLELVQDPSAGGTTMFLGTVRDRSEGRKVVGLEYEVYRKMADKKMREIEQLMKARWPVRKVAMVHRYGKLRVGEVSVAVAVSSAHRAEAFAACRYAIDAIKSSLPLWKKEEMRGASGRWVQGNQIRTTEPPRVRRKKTQA